MNYSYIIIEDQAECLLKLQNELISHTEFNCKGIASTVEDGILLTLTEKPNIIFLDVELADGLGFDVLKETTPFFNDPPFVIVISEKKQYAIKAINHEVLYYIEKPLSSLKLELALHKFKKRFSELKSHITIKDRNAHWFIKFNDVFYIQSDGSYCNIYRLDNTKIIVTKPLKEIETLLPKAFIRVHKSYLVNTAYIEKINTTNRLITLHHKTGIIKINEKNKSKLNELYGIQDNIIEIPIGEIYLERVKHALLTSRTQ
jgi:two-component system LytT family response regulator